MAQEREETSETLPLLRGTTTLQSALEQEEDILLDLNYPDQRIDFFVSLYLNREEIENIASFHLGLDSSDSCKTGEVNEWLHGSFNVCIPLYVNKPNEENPVKRALIRFPLPYKIGELKYPGNADEKLRCEAATFIWMQEHCPEISIPQLGGFGFVGGQSFTKPENTPLKTRLFWYLKRSISWLLGYTPPCHYMCHHRSTLLENGYLVMEHVGNTETQMLSETWDQDRHHHNKRINLHRGLSQIILSLSQTPLPRIGSWALDSNGVLQLSNRPLTLQLHQLENGGIPTMISRDGTYPTADTYYLDLLSCHDSRILHQPNSISSEDDGRAQMARLTIMRALLPHFTNRELRHGPFLYRLTDLHPSNIFVDKDWNIKWVIDLEWACALPAETLQPPYWLTGRHVDGLTEGHLDAFKEAYAEFMNIFEEEEKPYPPINGIHSYRTTLMKKGLEIGNFWYFKALESPKGLYNLFRQHIHPIFEPTRDISPDFSQIVSKYWAADMEDVIAAKLRDKEEYEKRVCQRFKQSQT